MDRTSRHPDSQQNSIGRRRTSVVDEEREPLFSASPRRWGYSTNEAIWPGEESEHIAHPTRACANFPVFHTIHQCVPEHVQREGHPTDLFRFRKDVVAHIGLGSK
jgi:hypothetical protein